MKNATLKSLYNYKFMVIAIFKNLLYNYDKINIKRELSYV